MLGQLSAELLDNFRVSLGLVVGVVLGVRSDHSFIAVSYSVDVLGSSMSESGLLGHHGGVENILSEVTTSCSSDLSSLGSPGVSTLASSIQVPGGVHHLHEVVVSVNTAGDVGVVFLEFFTSHDAVSLTTDTAVMM